MSAIEIKQFSSVFLDYFEPGTEVLNLTIEKLPQAGYGSIMVKADLTIKKKTGSTECKHMVAKLVPSNEMIKKMFQIEATFKNEVAFYKIILPTLKDFQKQQGVSEVLNTFAEFYGARLSLDKDEVDDNAVLVLENLITTGFQNIVRQEGFDLEGAKIVLKDLARFQGTVVALKLKQPETFKKKILPHCRDFLFPPESNPFNKMILLIIKENKKYAHLAEKMGTWPCKIPDTREPYATVAHGDLWVNNTMQKFENGKIIANKILDFQVYSYRSCASDVFFFLWTSCQEDVVKNNIDYLLKYYHDNFVETIKELDCDTREFSFGAFLEEIKLESAYEFGHSMFFVWIVKHESAISEENIKKNPSEEEMLASVPQRVKDFYYLMIEECDKRGWLH